MLHLGQLWRLRFRSSSAGAHQYQRSSDRLYLRHRNSYLDPPQVCVVRQKQWSHRGRRGKQEANLAELLRVRQHLQVQVHQVLRDCFFDICSSAGPRADGDDSHHPLINVHKFISSLLIFYRHSINVSAELPDIFDILAKIVSAHF